MMVVSVVVGRACQALEDDAAAHGDNVRCTPFARPLAVRDW